MTSKKNSQTEPSITERSFDEVVKRMLSTPPPKKKPKAAKKKQKPA